MSAARARIGSKLAIAGALMALGACGGGGGGDGNNNPPPPPPATGFDASAVLGALATDTIFATYTEMSGATSDLLDAVNVLAAGNVTRATLQDELMRIVAKTGATVLMVTHDVDEAVLLSDRVVMMSNGPAARIGEVLEVPLDRPRERLKLAHDARFMDLRAAVLEFLYEKQAHKAKLKVA